MWSKAEQRNRAKMEEESSLYRFRTKTHDISAAEEGEIDDQVVRQVFPIYDKDFLTLSDKEDCKTETTMEGVEDVQTICQFTSSEMREVFELHQQLHMPQSFSQHPSEQLFKTMKTRYSFAAAPAQKFDTLPG